MDEKQLLERITVDPKIFGGKPIVRGRRWAVEHVLGMLAAGDSIETILQGYEWLEREDVLACLTYARKIVAHERVELAIVRGLPHLGIVRLVNLSGPQQGVVCIEVLARFAAAEPLSNATSRPSMP